MPNHKITTRSVNRRPSFPGGMQDISLWGKISELISDISQKTGRNHQEILEFALQIASGSSPDFAKFTSPRAATARRVKS